MSQDPGHAVEDEARLAGLLEMYRTAIAHLESLRDPSVTPLKRELEALERFAGSKQKHDD